MSTLTRHGSGWLLALDPSVRSPGVALFVRGTLVHAERIRLVYSDEPLSVGERWRAAANAIIAWANRHCGGVSVVAYERPQIYAAFKSKGDPNDLVGLAAIGAAAAQALTPTLILSPTPAEWIGQVPKKTTGSAKTSPRGKRILSRLAANELLLVPDQHDAIDAIGIGLWAVGRLTTRRVLTSGA